MEVDGGFNVHGHSSLSWSDSTCTRSLAEGSSTLSQPLAGQGGFEGRRPDNSSRHQDASRTYAADVGARSGVLGELSQIFDREGRSCFEC